MKRKEIRIAVCLPSEAAKKDISDLALKEGRSMSNLLLRAFFHYKRTMEKK